MELGVLPIEYKIHKRKLMEYQRLLQMDEERLPKKATMQAQEMGAMNFFDELQNIMHKHNDVYSDGDVSNMSSLKPNGKS